MKEQRLKLKQLLGSLPEAYVDVFKRMYSYKDLTKDINSIVDELSDSKIIWCISQCENKVKKVAERRENKIKSIFDD